MTLDLKSAQKDREEQKFARAWINCISIQTSIDGLLQILMDSSPLLHFEFVEQKACLTEAHKQSYLHEIKANALACSLGQSADTEHSKSKSSRNVLCLECFNGTTRGHLLVVMGAGAHVNSIPSWVLALRPYWQSICVKKKIIELLLLRGLSQIHQVGMFSPLIQYLSKYSPSATIKGKQRADTIYIEGYQPRLTLREKAGSTDLYVYLKYQSYALKANGQQASWLKELSQNIDSGDLTQIPMSQVGVTKLDARKSKTSPYGFSVLQKSAARSRLIATLNATVQVRDYLRAQIADAFESVEIEIKSMAAEQSLTYGQPVKLNLNGTVFRHSQISSGLFSLSFDRAIKDNGCTIDALSRWDGVSPAILAIPSNTPFDSDSVKTELRSDELRAKQALTNHPTIGREVLAQSVGSNMANGDEVELESEDADEVDYSPDEIENDEKRSKAVDFYSLAAARLIQQKDQSQSDKVDYFTLLRLQRFMSPQHEFLPTQGVHQNLLFGQDAQGKVLKPEQVSTVVKKLLRELSFKQAISNGFFQMAPNIAVSGFQFNVVLAQAKSIEIPQLYSGSEMKKGRLVVLSSGSFSISPVGTVEFRLKKYHRINSGKEVLYQCAEITDLLNRLSKPAMLSPEAVLRRLCEVRCWFVTQPMDSGFELANAGEDSPRLLTNVNVAVDQVLATKGGRGTENLSRSAKDNLMPYLVSDKDEASINQGLLLFSESSREFVLSIYGQKAKQSGKSLSLQELRALGQSNAPSRQGCLFSAYCHGIVPDLISISNMGKMTIYEKLLREFAVIS